MKLLSIATLVGGLAVAQGAMVPDAKVDMSQVLSRHLRRRAAEGRDLLGRELGKKNLTPEQIAKREARRKKRQEQALLDAENLCQRGNPDIPVTCPKPRDNKNVEDRYCEDTFKAGATCGCKEVCHIWGDPHVSPFFSDCSTVAMTRGGMYTLYEVPVTGSRPEGLKLEGMVRKKDGHKMVEEFYVDGVLRITADDCKAGLVNSFVDQRPLVGDNGESITAVYGAYCDDKHRWHLNITIDLTDSETGGPSSSIEGLLASIRARNHPNPVVRTVPDSTLYFADDVGVCVDPLKYSVRDGGELEEDEINYTRDPFWEREECKRPSDGPDGRLCACAADCAAYGDPHVVDFYRDDDCPFLVKELDVPEQRNLYSLNPYFAAFMSVDECEYITAVHAVFRKDELVDAGDLSNPDNYWVATYEADEYCNDSTDVDPILRKRILVPEAINHSPNNLNEEISKKVFNQKVGGFSTGIFLNMVSVSDSSQSKLFAVPRDEEDDVEGFIAATSIENGDLTPDTLVESGGVQLILKCHITKEGFNDNFQPRKYWNVCVNRKQVATENLQDDDERRRRLQNNIDNMQTIEKTLTSAGHCALGVEVKNGNFQHRNADDITLFPYNPTEDA